MKYATTSTITILVALLVAGSALAAPTHHKPAVKTAAKTVKVVKVAVANPVHPRRIRRRRVRRTRRIRRHRTRIIRRPVIRPRVAVVNTRSVIRRPALSLQPRAAKPIRVSFTQKGVSMTGVELGVRIGNHLEITAATGVTSMPVEVEGCKGPGCATDTLPTWSAGVRAFPLRGGFSPYVSAGLMGSMTRPDTTVGLIGGGIAFSSHSGFTASLGIDYAIGETDSRKMAVPNLQLGFAF